MGGESNMIQVAIIILLMAAAPSAFVEIPNHECKLLAADVLSAPYYPGSYELHKFDCTEMSAIMEEHLTANGWDAQIICLSSDRGGIGHAQVVVHTPTNYYFIESTSKRVSKRTMQGYTVFGIYDDKEDAAENSPWGYTEWNHGLGSL